MDIQRTLSPADGTIVCERKLATPSELDTMLDRAVRAQRDWRNLDVAARARLCSRFCEAFEASGSEIAPEISRQMGRPVRYAPNEVRGTLERARHMISIAPDALADIDPGPKQGFRRFIRREPLGVVLVVAAWNYPFLIAVNSVVPALLSGNAVILKHSSQTPLCAERFAECFAAAGLPQGLFQVAHLDHDTTARAIADPRVDFVAFTGSVAGGHAVQRAAAGRFIGTGLELGGCDPAYVRHDADIAHAVENLVDGAFFNSGQSCCGIQRIYVHGSLYGEFVERAVALTRDYVLGNPMDEATTLGPVVRTTAADQIRSQVAATLAMGARAAIDERDFPMSRPGTAYLAPQILLDIDHTMPLVREEIFGPVVGIMSVNGDEQAVQLMNDSAYGLTAAVWTADADAAVALGQQIHTGTWFMNRCDYLDPALAWVGVKDSGRGCTLSRIGFEQLTRPKSFHLRLGT